MEGLTGHPEGAWPGLLVDDPPLDITALCRGFGASAESVDSRVQLPEALRDLWARARSGPAVLVARVSGRTAPVGYPLPT
jgi:thiamine pyrophosphate-dependent acetolactate synthase large subunit-like protein